MSALRGPAPPSGDRGFPASPAPGSSRGGDAAAYAATQESDESHAVSPPPPPAQICNGSTQVRPHPAGVVRACRCRFPGPRQGLGARSLAWLAVLDSTFLIAVTPVRRPCYLRRCLRMAYEAVYNTGMLTSYVPPPQGLHVSSRAALDSCACKSRVSLGQLGTTQPSPCH